MEFLEEWAMENLMDIRPAVVLDDVANAAFGYSIIEVDTIEEACALAKGNPMVAGGGSVEVAEIMPIQM